MKKTLLLLALSLQANAQQIYSPPQIKIQGAYVENLVETVYKHPRAKKVGDLMPQPRGNGITVLDMYRKNIKTGDEKIIGVIYGYDLNGDKIIEYEFFDRDCDVDSEVKTYAVYDAPNKKLYIDSSRNKHIDSIVEINSILGATLPMIPARCEEEVFSEKWKNH